MIKRAWGQQLAAALWLKSCTIDFNRIKEFEITVGPLIYIHMATDLSASINQSGWKQLRTKT